MSDSKSTDHWNVLARLLGTAPADVPEEETEMPEPPAAELVVEEPPIEPACEQEAVVEPEAVAEVVSVFEPAPVEVREPPKPAPKPEPRRTPSKPKQINHWRELASSLGIEVIEPEPEPEPEPAPEVKEADIPVIRVAPSPPARALEHRERADPGPRTTEPERAPERAERSFDAGMRSRSAPRHGSRRASLFEDPNLSLDTPGVLDAIFDEVEPETAVEGPAVVAPPPERIREIREDRRERAEKFIPREREPDLTFSDEPADEEVEDVEEVVTDRGESETPRDADEEDRSNRRRKRRPRRRGGRRDQKPATETTRDEVAEEGIEEEDEGRIERRSDATDILERRPAAPADEVEDLDDEAEDQLLEDEEEDGEEDASERLRLKHKKIPTWQQAIDAIVAVNMESRAKNPGGGGGGRGRGRRWRR